jgi:hypothetical protein
MDSTEATKFVKKSCLSARYFPVGFYPILKHVN